MAVSRTAPRPDGPAARRGRRWRRALTVLVAVLVALPLLGAGYQALAGWADARRYPPSGRLVDVGGFRLHLDCQGQGTPTILLESGAAGPGLMWRLVQPGLADAHRVCVYDRAGLGWSDRSPRPRTSENMVAELHALLVAADVAPPYLLVGHSLGGFNVRVYAARYPAEVAGVVLVNVTAESVSARLSPPCQRVMQANTAFARLMRPLTVLGVSRLADQVGAFKGLKDEAFGRLPATVQAELTALTFYRSQYWATFEAEVSGADEDGRQAAAAGSLGNLPLAVVAGQPDVSRIPPSLGCAPAELLERYRAGQDELAALSSDSSLSVCDTCGHYIPMTQPELVLDAVRQVLARLQSRE